MTLYRLTDFLLAILPEHMKIYIYTMQVINSLSQKGPRPNSHPDSSYRDQERSSVLLFLLEFWVWNLGLNTYDNFSCFQYNCQTP